MYFADAQRSSIALCRTCTLVAVRCVSRYKDVVRHCAVVLLVAVVMTGCTRSSQLSIEVTRGSDAEEKIRYAQRLLTSDELAKVKQQVKTRQADVRDDDLSSLDARVRRVQIASDEHVYIELIISKVPLSLSKTILKAAAGVLEEDLKSLP